MDTLTEGTRLLLLFSYGMFIAAYSVVIPASFEVLHGLTPEHSRAAWSGAVIGAYWMSGAVGMFFFRICRSAGWRYKPLFTYPSLGRVACNASFVVTLHYRSHLGSAVPWLLVLYRFLEGSLNASQILCLMEILIKTSRERVSTEALMAMIANTGVGVGMLIAAVTEGQGPLKTLYDAGVPEALSETPGLLTISFMAAFWVVFFVISEVIMQRGDPAPVEEEKALLPPGSGSIVAAGTDLPTTRKILIITGILATALRCLVNSGIDCVSVMILQIQWGWTRSGAAIAVGCCYMGSIVFHGLFYFLRKQVQPNILVHAGLGISILASFGIFNFANEESLNVTLLLVADAIIFPLSYLATAITMAFVTRAAVVGDPIFNFEMVIIWRKLFSEILGMAPGPVLARSMMIGSGRNAYALTQLLLLCAVMILWLAGINPCYQRLQKACGKGGEGRV